MPSHIVRVSDSPITGGSGYSVVGGPESPLSDSSDSTYIQSAGWGTINWIANLDVADTSSLPDYSPGLEFFLHARVSLTGGEGAIQPWEARGISFQLDVPGDDLGWFSGPGLWATPFPVTPLDGSIVDLPAIPLHLEPEKTVESVLAALKGSANPRISLYQLKNPTHILDPEMDPLPMGRVYEVYLEVVSSGPPPPPESRHHFMRTVRTPGGALNLGVNVMLRRPGSATLISDTVYSGPTGEPERGSWFFCPDGVVDFYLDTPVSVDVLIIPVHHPFSPTLWANQQVGDPENLAQEAPSGATALTGETPVADDNNSWEWGTPEGASVTSVNTESGEVTLSANDVGAIGLSGMASTILFLTQDEYNDLAEVDSSTVYLIREE